MMLTIAVSLYISRVVLNLLGANDYGLYSVVGGVVAMFSFLNATMANATQRFLNFEMGSKDKKKLRTIFSTSLLIHAFIAFIILVLAETVGLWFLNYKMNIEPNRIVAANWVYQCSILAFMVNIISVPYNAAIIAHEKMSAFAYISILEVTLKLIAVLLLQVVLFDKLIFYAVLLLIISVVIRIVYGEYSKRHFEECKFKLIFDKPLFKEMLSFSGWNSVSILSVMLKNHGVNILLNLIFGTVVNAARGLAMQINTVVNGFVTNFMQAMNPQIVKNYAKGDLDEMKKLIFYGSRFSFFLILFFALPILIEAETILKIWLNNVPEYTTIFTRLVLVLSMLESFNNTLWTAQAATGRVKVYHLTMSAIGLFNLPVSMILLYSGYPPYIPLIVSIILTSIMFFVRLLFLRKAINLNVLDFVCKVFLRSLLVALIAVVLPVSLHIYLKEGLINSLIVCTTCCVCVALAVFFIGLSFNEREKLKQMVRKKLKVELC
jgi:O-antigen/teichoic acid export membrane protein